MKSSNLSESAVDRALREAEAAPAAVPVVDAEGLAALENGVNAMLVDAEDSAAALDGPLAAICLRLGSETARLWALDAEGCMRLVRDGSEGTASSAALPANETVVESGQGLLGTAWRDGCPLWVADVADEPHALPRDVARVGVRGRALVLPVGSGESRACIFEFSGPEVREPDARLLEVLGPLTRRIADTHRRLIELEQLHESDECSNSTFELAAIGISHVGTDGTLLHVNPQLCELLGYSKDELVGRTVREISHPDDVHVTAEHGKELRSGKIDSFTAEKRYLHKDGSPVWVRLTVAVRRRSNGEPMYDVSIVEDISERKAAEEALRASEQFYHETFELAAIGISHVGADGTLLHVNRQLCELLGYSKEELVGRTVREISHPDDVHASDEDRAKLRAGEIDAFKLEKRYLRKDGEPVWVKITVAAKRAAGGEPLYDVSLVEDISDRKAGAQRIEYLATHDELTALPNRAMFRQLLASEVEVARRYTRKFSVLFVDLDRFKIINDSLGHEAGDTLLKTISSRFKSCLRSSDVVARLGGDEFVVLARAVEGRDEVASVARKLLSAALKPLDIGGHECRVTASVGISMFPEDGQDPQSLMKDADMAMYRAKEEGKNNFQFVSQAANSRSFERLTLENGLRRAFERNELSVQYQPKVDITTGAIKGVEALLRWNSAELGSVPPARFIPLAEDTGLIVPIGKWVLRTACAQNVAWQSEGLSPMTMAVNISPRQFRDPDLLQDVVAVLEETGMEPELLELEITEGMLMHNVDEAVKRLNSLKEMGIRLSIDDFGTGYSSLAQLKRFPIDTLKVDRSFIRDLPTDSEDKAITEAIISMGRTLGVSVIAEGVETAEQQTFLESHHCDQIQGFYFSRPIDAPELAEWVRAHVVRAQRKRRS